MPPTLFVKHATITCPIDERTEFPLSLPAIRDLTRIDFDTSVTFFVGENGSGKSTLLEAIAKLLNLSSLGGTQNFNAPDRFGDAQLHKHMRVAKSSEKARDRFYLRAESLFSMADFLEDLVLDGAMSRAKAFERYGGTSLHEQSHGESFLAVLSNLGGRGIYLFDEPEAALSPQRQLTALGQIHQLVQDNSQFIIATHSPILMAYPGARIYHFSEAGIVPIEYEETEHFKITKNFLNSYPRWIERLLE